MVWRAARLRFRVKMRRLEYIWVISGMEDWFAGHMPHTGYSRNKSTQPFFYYCNDSVNCSASTNEQNHSSFFFSVFLGNVLLSPRVLAKILLQSAMWDWILRAYWWTEHTGQRLIFPGETWWLGVMAPVSFLRAQILNGKSLKCFFLSRQHCVSYYEDHVYVFWRMNEIHCFYGRSCMCHV